MIYYVNASAAREGNGSKEMPFKWINDAAKIAVPGDEVVVAPGIYREYVDPQNAGTEEQRIVYRSEEPLGAVITGAEVVSNWKKYEGDTWVCRIDNGVFGSYNPYTTIVGGDWYFSPDEYHTGQVYLNGRAMYEALSLDDVLHAELWAASWQPQYADYRWYTVQDGNDTVIYANFKGTDPNAENVEINVRRECFFPSKTGVDYITFSGFNVSKAATTWAPPASFQDGMIGAHWSKGWIIEDCEVSYSRCCGISLGKYLDPENNQYFTNKHVKSPTQMERDAVCRGQYHGWLKEKVGSHIVRRCHIHDCEQTGIVGRMGCVFSIIEDNEIHHINNMQQLGGAEIAGIKFHAAIDVIFRRNHIHHCTQGIWCDWQAQGTRITQNLFHDNHRPEDLAPANNAMGGMGGNGPDVFIEVGHGPTLIDNNVMLSKSACRLATQGVALVHNLMLGALTSIGSGVDFVVDGVNQPRYTPYHIRHRTEVAGFMTILHGDFRAYNNIFIQNWPTAPDTDGNKESMGFRMKDNDVVGTSVYNGYPTYEEWIAGFELDKKANMMALSSAHFRHLPCWIDGNVYLNGAENWENEQHLLSDNKTKAYVKLVEEDGSYKIETNVYDIIGGFRDGIINSDILGKAFEPEERFENPDGTDIIFNQDYLGDHRNTEAVPGPFVDAEASKKVLWTFKA